MLGILAGAALAFLFPERVLWMRPALQPAFAATMFFVGTLVRPDQVRGFLEAPLRDLLECRVVENGRRLEGTGIHYSMDREQMGEAGIPQSLLVFHRHEGTVAGDQGPAQVETAQRKTQRQ